MSSLSIVILVLTSLCLVSTSYGESVVVRMCYLDCGKKNAEDSCDVTYIQTNCPAPIPGELKNNGGFSELTDFTLNSDSGTLNFTINATTATDHLYLGIKKMGGSLECLKASWMASEQRLVTVTCMLGIPLCDDSPSTKVQVNATTSYYADQYLFSLCVNSHDTHPGNWITNMAVNPKFQTHDIKVMIVTQPQYFNEYTVAIQCPEIKFGVSNKECDNKLRSFKSKTLLVDQSDLVANVTISDVSVLDELLFVDVKPSHSTNGGVCVNMDGEWCTVSSSYPFILRDSYTNSSVPQTSVYPYNTTQHTLTTATSITTTTHHTPVTYSDSSTTTNTSYTSTINDTYKPPKKHTYWKIGAAIGGATCGILIAAIVVFFTIHYRRKARSPERSPGRNNDPQLSVMAPLNSVNPNVADSKKLLLIGCCCNQSVCDVLYEYLTVSLKFEVTRRTTEVYNTSSPDTHKLVVALTCVQNNQAHGSCLADACRFGNDVVILHCTGSILQDPLMAYRVFEIPEQLREFTKCITVDIVSEGQVFEYREYLAKIKDSIQSEIVFIPPEAPRYGEFEGIIVGINQNSLDSCSGADPGYFSSQPQGNSLNTQYRQFHECGHYDITGHDRPGSQPILGQCLEPLNSICETHLSDPTNDRSVLLPHVCNYHIPHCDVLCNHEPADFIPPTFIPPAPSAFIPPQ